MNKPRKGKNFGQRSRRAEWVGTWSPGAFLTEMRRNKGKGRQRKRSRTTAHPETSSAFPSNLRCRSGTTSHRRKTKEGGTRKGKGRAGDAFRFKLRHRNPLLVRGLGDLYLTEVHTQLEKNEKERNISTGNTAAVNRIHQ